MLRKVYKLIEGNKMIKVTKETQCLRITTSSDEAMKIHRWIKRDRSISTEDINRVYETLFKKHELEYNTKSYGNFSADNFIASLKGTSLVLIPEEYFINPNQTLKRMPLTEAEIQQIKTSQLPETR
ncbi:hypothetical protein TI03_06575 [Achromatium sp. WMS1]|nr:hypothetical protein TI03_06575 [Achromatium sp. WMS1]